MLGQWFLALSLLLAGDLGGPVWSFGAEALVPHPRFDPPSFRTISPMNRSLRNRLFVIPKVWDKEGVRGPEFLAAARPQSSQGPAPEPHHEQRSRSDQQSLEPMSEEPVVLEEMVVTGTRIKRTKRNTSLPTTVMTKEDIERTGELNLIDVVNELPQIGLGTFSLGRARSNENTSFTLGRQGMSTANLRHLGPLRTLSLINGRRAVNISDDFNFLNFDAATLPPALIERIDVTTGGASAIYGADAVSGVINYIMKEDFEGIVLDVQGGFSQRIDSERYAVSGTVGTNFHGGRGNIAIAAGTYDSDGLLFRDRDQAKKGLRFRSNPDNTGPNDGIPDQVAGTGLLFSQFGIPNATIGTMTNLDGSPSATSNVLSFNPDGTPFIAIPGDQVIDGFLTKNDFGGDSSETDTAVVPVTRHHVFARAHYDFSEWIRGELTTRWAQTQSSDEIGPVFARNASVDTVQITNPFVTPELVTALGPGVTEFTFARQFDEFQPRRTEVTRNLVMIAPRLTGRFSNNWEWDVIYRYGHTHDKLVKKNDLLESRYAQALDAVTDGMGNIVCSDPSHGCVPLNPFGPEGTVTQEMVDFMRVDHTSTRTTDQHLLTGAITGDLFTLPSGPVLFAVGGEYRKDSIDFDPSDVYQNSAGFFGIQFLPLKASRDVKEGFAELLVPVVDNLPWMQRLTVEGAVRVAEYEYAGTETSWGGRGEWVLNESIRFRGSRGRSVRAPQLAELFNPANRGAAFVTDPCDALYVNENSNRTANCAALGIAQPFESNARSTTTNLQFTGNPDLEVEKSDAWNVGVVLTPSYLPHFSLSVDYYEIKLKGGIVAMGIQRILNDCVDLSSINNEFCGRVFREPDGDIIEVSDTQVNASRISEKGLDVEARYGMNLDEAFALPGFLHFRLLGTYVTTLEFIRDAEDSDAEVVKLAGEFFYPKLRTNGNITYSLGPFTLNWQILRISSMKQSHIASSEFRSPSGVSAQWYHDMQMAYQWKDALNLYLGIDNVFDKDPPFHPSTYRGNGLYSIVGRYFYAGVRVSFDSLSRIIDNLGT